MAEAYADALAIPLADPASIPDESLLPDTANPAGLLDLKILPLAMTDEEAKARYRQS